MASSSLVTHLFLHFFNKYMLSTYCMLGIAGSTWSKADPRLSSWGSLKWDKTKCKLISCFSLSNAEATLAKVRSSMEGYKFCGRPCSYSPGLEHFQEDLTTNGQRDHSAWGGAVKEGGQCQSRATGCSRQNTWVFLTFWYSKGKYKLKDKFYFLCSKWGWRPSPLSFIQENL